MTKTIESIFDPFAQMSIMCDHNKKAGYFDIPPSSFLRLVSLRLTDSEHLSATYRAHALGRRLAVLHCYGLGVFNLSLGTAFDTVSLHQVNLLLRHLVLTINQSSVRCQ